MIEKLIDFIFEKQKLTTLFVTLLLVGSTFGLGKLYINNDFKVFFSAEDKNLLAFEALQKRYTKSNNLLIALAPNDKNIFSKKTLAALEDITQKAWKTPYSTRVDSITNFQHSEANGDDLVVKNLYQNATKLSDTEIKKIKTIASTDPRLVHRLVSGDGHVAGVNITLRFPDYLVDEAGNKSRVDSSKLVEISVAHVRELKVYINKTYPDLNVYLSGVVMLNNAFGESIIHDMSTLMPLTLVLILLVVFALLRSLTATAISTAIIFLSVITTLGFTGWLGIDLSSPVMSAPAIIMTLAVADCVHVFSTCLVGMRNGLTKPDALKESLRVNLYPIFLTTLTTTIGFLSLNFSDSPPFKDLGNVAAIGVIVAFIFSITLLPILALLLPIKVKNKSTNVSIFMTGLANFVIAKQNQLLWGISISVIFLVALIPTNELNDVYVEYFDEKIQFRKDTDFIVKNLTGIYYIDYSIDTKVDGGVSDPIVLAKLKTLSDWLTKQKEVIHVDTITDTFSRLNKSMHGDKESWNKLPEERDLAAQYMLLYEMSLPFGLNLSNQINLDKSSVRLSVTLKTLSTKEVLSFEQRVQGWMTNNTPNLKAVGVSPTIMYAHVGLKNITSMLVGTSVALVLISLILIFALKSWRYGLLSLIPNLIPAGMAFGLWAIVSGEIGLALSVVTAMTLGIVVDDTIHFLNKYIQARRGQGMSSEMALHHTFSTVGVALLVTSTALIVGFLVLTTSAFKLNSGMGLLTAIIISFAIITDFLFLPPLLIKLDKFLNKDSYKEIHQ